MESTLERESKTPLYLQLSEKIRERIAEGYWKPGERLPTYKGMAEIHGVSKITVNQAMDQLVREGLIVRTQGSGTYVADPARPKSGLRRVPAGRNSAPVSTCNIGLFALDRETDGWEWTDFFHEPLRLAIHEAISCAGGRLLPEPILWNFLESALQNHVDGVLLSQISAEPEILARLEQLSDAGVPYVVVGGTYEDKTLPSVGVDNRAGMELAIQHLVERGHRRIAMVSLNLDGIDHRERWRAFQQSMATRDISIDLRLLLLHGRVFKYNDMLDVVRRWFDSGLPPHTAIIASSGMEGMATMRVLSERGIRVPDDVSLVSFDDSSAAALHNPPVTVVRQPLMELGRRSVEKLVDAIRSGQMPVGTETLSTQLIVRESTRAISN
jgi:GntR family transcriptional regulator of arabinose operon